MKKTDKFSGPPNPDSSRFTASAEGVQPLGRITSMVDHVTGVRTVYDENNVASVSKKCGSIEISAGRRVPLPEPVAHIYEAVEQLKVLYPGRSFTPDGHLVGSIGEVIAAEALGLKLHKAGEPGHDAFDGEQQVQIKITGGRSVAMYATCERLVVLRIVSPREAEIVYDGPGAPAWSAAGRMAKNGQRVVSLAALRMIASKS
jgi:hypothetical protein